MTNVWIYKLKEDFHCKSTTNILQNISFECEWGNIRDGVLTIYKGYAWDGCTPKYKLFGKYYIGVWDGWDVNGKPACYYASLVHDFICQYGDILPITKKQSVQVFDSLLKETNWPFRKLYVKAVDLFGPQKFYGDVLSG